MKKKRTKKTSPPRTQSSQRKRGGIVALDGNTLTLEQFRQIVFDGAKVSLAPSARKAVKSSRKVIDRITEKDVVAYGVTTGFGDLARIHIPPNKQRELQLNLVRSHAAGVGAPLSEEQSRATLLLRTNVLAKGLSGVREVVVDTLLGMLNHGIHPVIPSRGSVGASGDLAPLSHLALVALGEGEAFVKGKRISGAAALKQTGIKPLKLEPKEGLAMVNGTQSSLALGLIALLEAETLVDTADVAAALSLDALRGTPVAFDPRIHNARPFPGQLKTAQNLLRLLDGSGIRQSHENCPRVQDAYSLRCTPQVHGSVREALTFVRHILTIELNAGTDNPLVFAKEGEVISGGNFHGAPLALALDTLGIALTQLGNISERRTERLIQPAYSDLPAFLTKRPGIHSGFMMAQVTAAALASENKILAHPASSDSIPTSGNEDFVSMSMGAALKAGQMADNVRTILAVEILCGCQGIDLLAPLKTSPRLERAKQALRSWVPMLKADRELTPDIEAARKLVASGAFQTILSD
jgi:histidine ammonia-lyase